VILREEDEDGRVMVMRDTSATRRLNRDQVMEICRLISRESLVCVYIRYVR